MTNYIVVDILRKILDADMLVCDLSARNSNVLYELGIRQAFNRPVTLIRDSRTPRIFDIQGLRDLEYDESLRIDKINSAVESLTNLLKNTSNLNEGDVNSIIQLLGVKPAQVSSVEVSMDTSLVLNAINDISKRISRLEDSALRERLNIDFSTRKPTGIEPVGLLLKRGLIVSKGARVRHRDYGEGKVTFFAADRIVAEFDKGVIVQFLPGTDEIEKLKDASEREK